MGAPVTFTHKQSCMSWLEQRGLFLAPCADPGTRAWEHQDGRYVIRTKPAYVNRRMAVAVENDRLEHPRRSLRARRSTELASPPLSPDRPRNRHRQRRCEPSAALASVMSAAGEPAHQENRCYRNRYIRRSMIRGLARLGETSGAFAVGCIKSACETRALQSACLRYGALLPS